jgi:hypothetical protein
MSMLSREKMPSETLNSPLYLFQNILISMILGEKLPSETLISPIGASKSFINPAYNNEGVSVIFAVNIWNLHIRNDFIFN